jgi:hypothetical protein
MAGEGARAVEVAVVFFLDSTATVTFLAVTFFFFFSMEANTSRGTTYSS